MGRCVGPGRGGERGRGPGRGPGEGDDRERLREERGWLDLVVPPIHSWRAYGRRGAPSSDPVPTHIPLCVVLVDGLAFVSGRKHGEQVDL